MQDSDSKEYCRGTDRGQGQDPKNNMPVNTHCQELQVGSESGQGLRFEAMTWFYASRKHE
jgi:hypothetical protein